MELEENAFEELVAEAIDALSEVGKKNMEKTLFIRVQNLSEL